MLSTDRQTNKQTNATKNITSFAKDVITACDKATKSILKGAQSQLDHALS